MSEHLPPMCRMSDILPVLPIGRTTVWRWVKDGRFPAPVKRGRMLMWPRAVILDWLKLEDRHV